MKHVLTQIGWVVLELLTFLLAFAIVLGIQLGILHLCGLRPLDLLNGNLGLSEQTNPYPLLLLNYLPLLVAFGAASILVHFYIFKRPFIQLGYVAPKPYLFFGQGWFWSMLMIIPGFLILWLLGQIKMLPSPFHLFYFLGFLIFFIVQSTGEEVLTRAFLIPMLEKRLGTLVALILSGSLFGIMHIGNNNFTWTGFTNILLGGLIMAIFFIVYRNIWICAGYHSGWNFIQAGFLDFNVSGEDVNSFIQFQDVGYPRITGAAFGYEGSLVAIIFQSVLLIYLIRKHKASLLKPIPILIPNADDTEPALEITPPMFTLDPKYDMDEPKATIDQSKTL